MPAPTASAEATKDAEDSGRPVGYVEPLSGAGALPVVAYTAYRRAADAVSCGLDWTLLAGIGKVESNHGRDSFTETGEVEPAIFGPPTMFDGARAEGPMQFMPFTWERYAADGNADGLADTQNMYDATLAAAHYLCAAGGDVSVESGRYRAVFAYNHLDSYVHNVLEFARVYADGLPESAASLVPIEDVAPEQDPDPSLSASPVAGTPIAEPPPVGAPSETPSAGPTPTPTVVPPPPPPPPPPTTPTTAPPTTPTTAPPTTTPAPAPPSSEASTAASSPSPMPAPTPSNASPSPTPSPAPSGA